MNKSASGILRMMKLWLRTLSCGVAAVRAAGAPDTALLLLSCMTSGKPIGKEERKLDSAE